MSGAPRRTEATNPIAASVIAPQARRRPNEDARRLRSLRGCGVGRLIPLTPHPAGSICERCEGSVKTVGTADEPAGAGGGSGPRGRT